MAAMIQQQQAVVPPPLQRQNSQAGRPDSELARLICKYPAQTSRFLDEFGSRLDTSASSSSSVAASVAASAAAASCQRRASSFANYNNNNRNNSSNNSSKSRSGCANPYAEQRDAVRFSELPSFADSILMPGRSRHLNTTTQMAFPNHHANAHAHTLALANNGAAQPGNNTLRRPSPFLPAESSLKPDGQHSFATTHQLNYASPRATLEAQQQQQQQQQHLEAGEHDKKVLIGGAGQPQTVAVPGRLHQPMKFFGETQFMRDFAGAAANTKGGVRAQPVCPAPASIDLRFDRGTRMSTEQRREFRGHCPLQHPAPPPYKKTEQFEPPSKFASGFAENAQTMNQLQFPVYKQECYRAPPLIGGQDATNASGRGGRNASQQHRISVDGAPGGGGAASLSKFCDKTTNRTFHRDFRKCSAASCAAGNGAARATANNETRHLRLVGRLKPSDVERLRNQLKQTDEQQQHHHHHHHQQQ